MIDFIRIQYKDKSVIEPFVTNEENFSELRVSLEYHSEEILYPYVVFIKNMEVRVNEKSVYVKNSLHKLNNLIQGKGDQNHNDFCYSDLCECIDYLYERLTHLETAEITQLEFGLNIKVPKPAETIIIENVFMHKYKGYDHKNTFNGKGQYMQFDHSNYFIKIYDKAKQYNRDNNILRFEIKFRNKKDFRPLGVEHIGDLKSKAKLLQLFNYLITKFDEMIIVDNIDESEISKNDFRKLERYMNFNFWQTKQSRKLRNQRTIDKKEFDELLEKNDLLQTKSTMREILIEKFETLINQ